MDFFERLFRNFQHSFTKQILLEAFSLTIQLLPYLVVGIILSTLIKRNLSAERLKKWLDGKNMVWAIILASLLGIVSPLGSYVVIPLSAAFISSGLPLAPIIAFMVSSPLINPGLFLLTWGALGPEMAIARVIASLIIGSGAGFLSNYFISHRYIGIKPPKEDANSFDIKQRPFLTEIYRFTLYISKHFFIGILIAAITKILVPVQWIYSIVGQGHFFSILFATAAGVPLYSCGGAAIPVMVQLADIGIDKGAILAFFISGPATKISNIVLLTALYKRGILIIYLALSIFGALFLGLLYHYF